MRVLVLSAALALAACTSRPEVDALLGPEPTNRTYPALLPIDEFPAPDPAPAEASAEANAALEARAEALRRRAAAIAP